MSLVMAGTFSAGLGLAESGLVALVVQGLLWILVALLLPLRRLRGWRLRRGHTEQPVEQKRYGTRDLLIWMMVIAVPLAIFRLLMPPGTEGTVTAGLRVIALLGLLLVPLLWLEILMALRCAAGDTRGFLAEESWRTSLSRPRLVPASSITWFSMRFGGHDKAGFSCS